MGKIDELREIETTAMNIVYQISDILVPDGADGVKLRQANNDKMINFTAGLITALIKQHTDRAVVEELEFAYKMATPEQKQALKDLYADRGVNKGLSFTPQANLQSKESE